MVCSGHTLVSVYVPLSFNEISKPVLLDTLSYFRQQDKSVEAEDGILEP